MLRSFLCRDALLAQITVPSLLLAVFLLPLGTGIYAWLPWFPWWAPSLLPLAVLALVYLWVALSSAGAMPRAWRPWAMSPRTIWLGTPLCPTPLSPAMRARLLTRGCRDADKCCIDQSSPEMIAAGVSSFGAFLARCENMVAFTSPNYFSRLWCVPAPNHPPASVSTALVSPHVYQVRVRARHLLPHA